MEFQHTKSDPSRAEYMKSGTAALFAFETLLLMVLAAAVRLATMPQEPINDELFHVLAAKQFLADGTLSIAEGLPYERARLFTLAVAASMRMVGETLLGARFPSLIAGTLVVGFTFVWLRSLGERWAGWIAGILLIFDPVVMGLSQMSRFYSFQHLSFLLGVIAVYCLLARPLSPWRSLSLVAAALLFLALALTFQPVSIIGFFGLVLFVVGYRGPAVARRAWESPWRWWLFTSGMVGAALLAGLMLRSGLLDKYLALVGFVPPSAEGAATSYEYYFVILLDWYPALWSLFPLSVLLAIRRQPLIALLCTCVFGVTLMIESLVPWKGARFLTYVIPMFAIVSALSVVEACRFIRGWIVELLNGFAWTAWRPRTAKRLAAAGVVIILGFAAVAHRPFYRAAIAMTRTDLSYTYPGMPPRGLPVSWARARAVLKPYRDRSAVLVSSSPVKALYFLGQVDYVLNTLLLRRLSPEEKELIDDERFGRPVIASPRALETVMACHESGLIVVERSGWRGSRITPETADYIEANAQVIELPERWGVLAFHWTSETLRAGRGCSARSEPGAARAAAGQEQIW